MDLLDNLEDREGSTFKLQYDTQIIQDEIESGAEDNNFAIDSELGSPSVLDKVKRRLAQFDTGKADDVSEVDGTETQVIEPKWDKFDFSSSIFGKQNTDSQTQVIERNPLNDHHLPQLDIEDVDIESPEQTQRLDSTQTQAIPQVVASLAATTADPKEERLARISKLAMAKRNQRLEKEREEEEKERAQRRNLENEELLADITHTTLTDEEQDLQDSGSVVASNLLPTTKSLKEAEEFLQVQKRSRNLQPEFKKKNVFTTENLLNEFNDDESDDESSIGFSSNRKSNTSPITSPLKTIALAKDHVEDNEAGSDEADDHIPTDPISEYAHNLKTQLLSSPSMEVHEPKMIDLDEDDADDDLEFNSKKQEEEIPSLSKVEMLNIKQKFLKKKLSSNPKSTLINLPKNIRNSINNQEIHRESKSLINRLQKANIHQLQIIKQANPLNEEIIELEKDEEVMGSLLERELERARNIRKKEKLLERAKIALLNEDEEYTEAGAVIEDEGEVPDSDFDGSENEDVGLSSEDEDVTFSSSEGEREAADHTSRTERKSKRLLISDDEDDEFRKDDSYMFGAASMDNEDSNNANHEIFIKTASGEVERTPDANSINNIAPPTQKYELFQNLKVKKADSFTDTQNLEADDADDFSHLKVPSFNDIAHSETPISTQADITIATQIDDSQLDFATQKISNTQHPDDDDDDDEINPVNVRRGRNQIKKNISDIEEEVSESEELNEEETKKQIKDYEQKIRRQEFKTRKKRKEMERRGLKNIIEGEAEESEDEWHGLGGIDAELSDEQANSEDEKMIDNNFNIDLNDEEVKRKFMEQYQIKDKKELEKLLDDIKHHRLTKRIGSKNGFDIELSDEEDELLTAYRKQRLAEQRARLLESKKIQELAKNEKSRAFFTSIQDHASVVRIDEEEEEELTDSDKENVKVAGDDEDSEKDLEAELEASTKKKRTIKVQESFVQKQLSFLRNFGDDQEQAEYLMQQKISNRQHGYESDEQEFEDIQALKRRCLSNLAQGSQNQSTVRADSNPDAVETDADNSDADDDSEYFPSFNRPSLVHSFRSSNEIETNSFSGVTIRKQYKVATGAKASISGMSTTLNKSASVTTSLKDKKITKLIHRSRNGGLFQNNGFDNQ